MATTVYCPNCWKEVAEESTTCIHCGSSLRPIIKETGCVTRLIEGLSNSRVTTRIRAATILGQLRADAAVEPMLRILRNSHDEFLQAAVIQALGKICDPRSRCPLEKLTECGSSLLRQQAREALKQMTVHN